MALGLMDTDRNLLYEIMKMFEFWYFFLQMAFWSIVPYTTPGYYPFNLAKDVAFNILCSVRVILQTFGIGLVIAVDSNVTTRFIDKCISLSLILLYFLYARVFALGFQNNNNSGLFGDLLCIPVIGDCSSRRSVMKTLASTMTVFLVRYLVSLFRYGNALILIKSRVVMSKLESLQDIQHEEQVVEENQDINSSIKNIVNYMVDKITSKVTQNMAGEKPQNGFDAVNKAAETFGNSASDNKN
jgi:hypothetical protein